MIKYLRFLTGLFALLQVVVLQSNAQPKISSFSPVSSAIGTVVTISGSGFDGAAPNNLVYFGGVRATVTGGSATGLTVVVPAGAGYQPVSVLNTVTGLAGSSANAFVPAFNVPTYSYVNENFFQPKISFGTGEVPYALATGDLDGDGKLDIVASNHGANTISVLRNVSATGSLAASSFALKVDFPVGANPFGIAVSDLDGDGKLDIVVANRSSGTVSVLRNTSQPGTLTTASFAGRIDFSTGSSSAPIAIATGDLDGDGKPDIVAANPSGNTVAVLRNLSLPGAIDKGSFAGKVDFTVGNGPNGIVIRDLDGDGRKDLATSNQAASSLSVLRNLSVPGTITTTSFAARVDFTTGAEPYGIVAGDLDVDGKPDLVCVNHAASTVSALRNISSPGSINTSSFAGKVDFTTGTQPFSVSLGELTGDGRPEIITANGASNTVSVLENFTSVGNINTFNSFFSNTEFSMAGYPLGVVVEDINNDGVPEMVTSTGSGTVSILRKFSLLIPAITSFTPATARPGKPITISGNGFNAEYYRNRVFFGAVQGAVTGGSETSLTVNVPAGASYEPISVLNTAITVSGYAAKPFTTSFTNPAGSGIPANYYQPRVDFPISAALQHVAIGDLDGDGSPDMIVANLEANTISLLRNISTTGSITPASFASKVDIYTVSGPRAVALADINGDGKPDIIVVNSSNSTVSIYQNNTSRGSLATADFDRRAEFSTGFVPYSVAVADLDSNGKPDLVTANSASGSLSVFRNTTINGYVGQGSFAARVDIPVGGSPYHVTAGDVDGDGKPDLLVANYGLNTLSMLRNTSVPGSLSLNSSSFAPRVDFATGANPYDVAWADIDGDGKQDAVVANFGSGTVSVLRNIAVPGTINGASFASKIDFTTNERPISVTANDLDGDGKPDLAIACRDIGISVLRNEATAGTVTATSLVTKVSLPTGGSVNTVISGDLDGDGIPELVTSSIGPGFVGVFRVANFTAPGPQINSFTPASGPVGTALTVKGSGFSATPSGNTVYLGDVRATVTAGSDTSLTVTVPPGASYKPVSVLNQSTGLAALSAKPFVTTFANPFGSGIPANFYLPAVNFSSGSFRNVVTGDVDGDGKPDVVVSGGSGVFIYRNTAMSGSISTNSLSAPIRLSGDDVTDITIGDMDGDGKPDIVFISGVQTASVLKNNTTPGSISAAAFSRTDFTTGSYPFYVKVGDLDGDGKPEIATASLPSSSVTILRNTGKQGIIDTASFAEGFSLLIGGGSFAINDLDGDGKPELITSSGSGIQVSRNLTTVPGSLRANSFAASVLLNGAGSVYSVSTGDINGDGKPEIVYPTYSSNAVCILQNLSTPGAITASSFAAPVIYAVGGTSNNAVSVAISDLDGDAKPDLVSNSAEGVAVFRNLSGTGNITSSSFAAAIRFSANVSTVAAADLDGDGIPEIVTSSGVSVLRINNTGIVAQQPVITSIVPATGPPGTQVTISGFNFNVTAASNIVYFGAVRAAVTAASLTSLTVTVPLGATHTSVSVFNKGTTLTGYSANPFNISFTNPAGSGTIPDNFYKKQLAVPTGILPYQVALGDLNGDGKTDMVVVNENANSISIIKNVSASGILNDSSFSTTVSLPVGADPRAVAIGDVNADGQPDIVVASSTSSTVTVFCYLGFPANPNQQFFYYKGEYAVGANPYSVAIGDVDGDGLPDIITANISSGTVSVLRNTYAFRNLGTPSFAPKADFTAGSSPRSVAVSDLDGDGKVDIAVTNERSNTVSVLRNTAGPPGVIDASSFAPLFSYATGSNPNGIITSDVDGDGRPDLIISNYGSNSVSVLRNTAVAGLISINSFAAKADFSTGSQPFFVAAAEVNGDGKPDLVTVNSGSGNLSVLRNTAVAGSITTGSFDGKVDFATGGYPVGVAGGDLDGDGITELLAASAATNTVSVLSFSQAGHPLIASLSPDRGPAGTTLTITGANFNAAPTNNVVYFGAVKAAVTGGSTGSLTVHVPAGVTYQPVAVLDTTRGLAGYSSKPFMATFANPFGSGIPGNFYRPRVDFALGGPFTYAVAFGDLDGDGKPDMVAVNEQAGTVSVLRNITATGSIDAGSFAGRVDIATAPGPRSVVVSDIDGDGKLDIIAASPGSYTISVLRNALGSGSVNASSFTRIDLQAGAYISAFAVGDLDDDGRPDLVFANPYAGTVSVRRNLSVQGAAGAVSFAAPVDFRTGDFPRAVVITDADGDGKPDMVIANEQSGTVSVLRNTGRAGYMDASSFAAKVDFPATSHPPALAAGDVDGDGKADLVIASYDSSSLTVLRNTGTPGVINLASFAPGIRFATGSNPYSVALGDADGDGKADLITANSTANTVSVLRNTGTAGNLDASSFASKVDFGAGGYPLQAVLGDLDGDGIAELGIANAASGAISVLKVDGVAALSAVSRNSMAAAEQQTAAVQLYPNPTDGAFTLQLPNLKGITAVVEIVNENGGVIERKTVNGTGSLTSLKLTLSRQPAGTYYVKVTGADGVQVMKVVKR